MADLKPFHESIVAGLFEAGDWVAASTLLNLAAKTKVPDGEGSKLVTAAIDAAIRFNDDVDVNKSAVAVIVAHDGRAVLQERFTADNENETLEELVNKFNEQEGVEPIKLSESIESDGEEEPRHGAEIRTAATIEAS